MPYSTLSINKIKTFLLLTVISILLISCGPKAIDKKITSKEGKWHISRYQVFGTGHFVSSFDDFDNFSINRNYEDMGDIQFFEDQSAIYTYDSVSVNLSWNETYYYNESVEKSWDLINLELEEEPSLREMRIPFIENNYLDSVRVFKVVNMEQNMMMLRYRFQMNNNYHRGYIQMVDMYLTRD